MIKKTIYNKILWHNVEVLIANTDKEFDNAIKYCNKIKDIDCEWTHKDIWWMYTYSNITLRWYIIINWFNIPEISHEISHLIFQLFDNRWIPIRLENDEIFSYHMQFYMKEILAMQPKALPKQ